MCILFKLPTCNALMFTMYYVHMVTVEPPTKS